MALSIRGAIEIPDGRNSDFDHGAFDPKTRRVFIAHTARGLHYGSSWYKPAAAVPNTGV